MNATMVPLHVRFTPEAEELDELKRAMTPYGLRLLPIWFWCIFGAFQFAVGALNLWLHGLVLESPLRIVDSIVYGFQMCLGAAYPLLYYVIRKRSLSRRTLSIDPGIEVDLTLDDSGIVVTEPQARRIPWTDVADIRDFGEAFVIAQRRGRSFPIFKRALPDRGMALWAVLDAKLSARRYLVRSTLGPPTIYNRLAPAHLR
jgi:hypothetical protein